MKIHPAETARNDLAHFQLHTAPQLLDRTNGLNQLADKHRRIQRLATRARHERRWNKDEEARLVSKAEIPKATLLAVVVVSVICALVSAPFADWKGSPIGQGASLLSTWDVKKGSKALRGLLGLDTSPQEAKAIDGPKVRADCEKKFRTERFAQSDIVLCSSVWDELRTKGGQ